ncbi:BspA family leucine-rich repeat surface protein [Eudoraea sp.]|uniref:BspA family leucine-rich repeat surface protein n=1 Tax=Eudoraea sp. TaxID=1979955 RepID=UPI003C7421B3
MKKILRLSQMVPVIILLLLGCTKDSDDETISFTINVSITPSGGGTVSPSSGTFDEGTVVTMEGIPSNGYSFVEWTGSVQSTDNPVTITMDSDKNITGIFEILDSDEDGITDDLDTCPDTPSGEQVDENGCSLTQSDSDEDGVTDDLDTCPDTPSGEQVDENGCSDSQKDTDEDGVTDDIDLCSDTPQGENVDENGCPTPSPIYLDENGVTIKCYEWGEVGDTGIIDNIIYKVVDETKLREMVQNEEDVTTVCTTKVTSMIGLFMGNLSEFNSFNQNISSWDVSNVTDMNTMFLLSSFNQDISSWDVSSVTNMSGMFSFAPFNQPIGTWDVSSVTTMKGMFSVSPFDQPIGDWDVSNVIDMSNMFQGSQFNQPIGNWNVSGVTDMSYMFAGFRFNQDISSWDVSSVTNMKGMFVGSWGLANVNPFDQDISSWDVSKVSDMSEMFKESNLNQDLSSWNVNSVINCDGFSENTPQWVLPKPNFTNCTP